MIMYMNVKKKKMKKVIMIGLGTMVRCVTQKKLEKKLFASFDKTTVLANKN